jgi:hypothetical protein
MLMRLGSELVTATGSSGVDQVWTITPALAERHGRGAYLIEVTIQVSVGVVPLDHSGVARNLKHKEASPEGEIEATWEIVTRDPATWTPDLDYDAHQPVPFTLSSNESGTFVPFFGGFIGRVVDSQMPNGFHRLQITGRGAYITLSWQPILNEATFPADTAGHVMVETVYGVYAPYISSDHTHIVDGGLQLGQEFEQIGRTSRDCIDYVSKRGEPDGEALDWYVRTDTDGNPKLWLFKRTRHPTVEIPISTLKAPASMVRDVEYVKNMVIVKWAGGYVDEAAGGGAVTRRRSTTRSWPAR